MIDSLDEQRLKSFVEDTITHWRSLFGQLSPEEQQYKSMPFYFAAPLQIEVFRFFNQVLEVSVQLWVISQFEDCPDMEVICHNIETNKVQKQIVDILEEPRFDRYLEDSWRLAWYGESLTYRQAVAEACESSLRKLNGDLSSVIWRGPKYGMVAGGGYPSEKLWFWTFDGDPTFESIKLDIDDSISHARTTRPNESLGSKQAETIRKERKYDLVGSYFYPPVWIGERPKPSVQQLLSSGIYGTDYFSGPFTNIICEYVIDGIRIVATQGGLIAINSQDKRLFLDLFNILIALLNLEGYKFLTLRENELVYLDYFANQKDNIHPSFHESNKVRLSPWLHRDLLTPVVSIESLKQSFQLSQQIVNNETLKDLFIIIAEAGSHLFQKEYSQSVLWAWIFIERWVSFKWTEYLSSKDINVELIDALDEIDLSRNLRALGRLKIIDVSTRKQLDKLRNLRNNIAHRGSLATQQEANEASDMCIKLLLSLINGTQ